MVGPCRKSHLFPSFIYLESSLQPQRLFDEETQIPAKASGAACKTVDPSLLTQNPHHHADDLEESAPDVLNAMEHGIASADNDHRLFENALEDLFVGSSLGTSNKALAF